MTRIFTKKRRRRPLRRLLLLALGLVALWAAGLIWYAESLPAPAGATPIRGAQAAIVLTGGAGRIAEGFRLLDEGYAADLFISGVYRGTEVRRLRELRQSSPEATEDIHLGDRARDTLGNARESARWVRETVVGSVYLVTSDYHMPRSLAAFRAALPAEVVIVPHPVGADRVKTGGWWRHPGTARLIAGEYSKFLITWLAARLGLLPV